MVEPNDSSIARSLPATQSRRGGRVKNSGINSMGLVYVNEGSENRTLDTAQSHRSNHHQVRHKTSVKDRSHLHKQVSPEMNTRMNNPASRSGDPRGGGVTWTDSKKAEVLAASPRNTFKNNPYI